MVNLSRLERAMEISSSASSSSSAIGFSRNTCLPARRKSLAIGKCVVSGVAQTKTAEISLFSSKMYGSHERLSGTGLGANTATPTGANDGHVNLIHLRSPTQFLLHFLLAW